jgi:myo-inositol-1(or 4)-monophosphatase
MRPELDAALEAIDIAVGLMARRVGAERVASKGGRDLVTDTDVAVEDAIRAVLLYHCPDYTVVGEERGGESEVGDRPYWLVDPICGTRNFASQLPLYAVNVALVEDGRVTLAAIGDGASGDRYVAEWGHGARMLGYGAIESLRASDASVTMTMDVGAIHATEHTAHAASFARAAISSNRWYVRMFGTSLAFVHLAAGRLSAHLVFKASSPVHNAAGCLLAGEAGALVTDVEGRPWDLTSTSCLAAATPELHHDLLAMVAAARPGA